MPKRDGDESRKNWLDGARLNPKHFNNGQLAGKLRIGEPSTTISKESTFKRMEAGDTD